MKHILVIGGNNAFGLSCVLYLLQKGFEVTATYRSDHNSQELLSLVALRLNVIRYDVSKGSEDELYRALASANLTNIDTIIYNADIKGFDPADAKGKHPVAKRLMESTGSNLDFLSNTLRSLKKLPSGSENRQFIYINPMWRTNIIPLRKNAFFSKIRDIAILYDDKFTCGSVVLEPKSNSMAELVTDFMKLIDQIAVTKDSGAVWSSNGRQLETYFEDDFEFTSATEFPLILRLPPTKEDQADKRKKRPCVIL